MDDNEFIDRGDGAFTDEITIPYTYTLKFPVTLGTEPNTKTWDKLILERRPMAVDMKGFKNAGLSAEDVMRLLSRICAVPLKVIETLDIFDFMKMQEVFVSFLPGGG